jgi:hypothetical protein
MAVSFLTVIEEPGKGREGRGRQMVPLPRLTITNIFGSTFGHAVIGVSKAERLWHMVKNGYGEGEELWRRGLRRRLG